LHRLVEVMNSKASLLLLVLIVIPAEGVFAQKSKSDVCYVGIMDYSGKDPERQDFVLTRRLGTFEPLVGEEERTTRVFRLPGIKLFVVASVFYTDESIGIGESVSLQVSVSSKRKFDPLHSLRNAEAEVVYRPPYVARSYLLLKVRGRPKLIMIECRRDTTD
jgi:hypothetical protein